MSHYVRVVDTPEKDGFPLVDCPIGYAIFHGSLDVNYGIQRGEVCMITTRSDHSKVCVSLSNPLAMVWDTTATVKPLVLGTRIQINV